MDAKVGVEPTSKDYESLVLPLHYLAINILTNGSLDNTFRISSVDRIKVSTFDLPLSCTSKHLSG